MPLPPKRTLKATIKVVRAMTGALKRLQTQSLQLEKELTAHLNPAKHTVGQSAETVGTTSEIHVPKTYRECWKRAADGYKAVRSRPGCDRLTYQQVFARLKSEGRKGLPPTYKSFANYCRRYRAYLNSPRHPA